jgi:hypothetical protein
MHLHLSNVLNPDIGSTEPVYIATYYDGVLIDSTDSITGQEDGLFIVTKDPEPLVVTSYDFYP